MTMNTDAVLLPDEQIAAMKAAALAATPQDIDNAQRIDHFEDGSHVECPACGGEGHVELEADFCNYDGTAIGVQFYGVGNAHGAAEAYLRAANPANVLALIRRLERAEAALLSASKPAAPAQSAEPQGDGDLVLVKRGLLGAACSAIDKKRDAPKVLEKLRAITFAPAASAQSVTMDEDELAEFRQTAEDFEDNGETSTPYDILMDWAERGFLDCTRFELTSAGKALIGKPVDVVHFATPQNLAAPQPSPTAVVLDDERAAESLNAIAKSVFGGINALRWLLNITTEFDRKDVRTRQAARLLDEYCTGEGTSNRVHLEHLWKTLNDTLSLEDTLECLRAPDRAVAQPVEQTRALADDALDADLGAARGRISELEQELRNIANADTAEWDDPTQFEAWAKSRARHTLGAPAKFPAPEADRG